MNSDFPATRWSLVGAPDAHRALLALYAEPIARYLAGKLPDAARDRRLDDIVQDTLAWLAEHPEVLTRARPAEAGAPPSRFRWYLMTVAFNQARNALRRLRGEAVGMGEAGEPEAPGEAAAAAMDRAWAEAVIADAWRDLSGWAAQGACPPDLPELARQHLADGLGLRELAARSGLPLTTLHRRISQARTLLRRAIADRLRAAGECGDDELAACDALLALLR